jgi:hypothetical protein
MKPHITQWICEGVDGLGKSTLIDAIIDRKGYHPVIHYSKPKILSIYENCINIPEYEYQYAGFVNLFQLIHSQVPLIFDRAHIGECVYGPLYRGTDGDYVFDLEKQFAMANKLHVKMILLTCNNAAWHLVEDDGESFDADNKGQEQWEFIQAFERSIIPNKQIIDIATIGDFGLGFRRKTIEEILAELSI